MQIGTGHVMRCLSLADELKCNGVTSEFVCRTHEGQLSDLIESRGYRVHLLPSSTPVSKPSSDSVYANWLGAIWQDDARETAAVVDALEPAPDWLIVDHYAVDAEWEKVLRASTGRIMVIDDLANRPHDCDLLLDQNHYEDAESRYAELLPTHCQMLTGPKFSLLRKEFRDRRSGIDVRSKSVRRIFVAFGGVDSRDHTSVAIDALSEISLDGVHVDVVIGTLHPNRQGIEAACAASGFTCHVQSDQMASLMAAADIAIGAGGTGTWERCCTGLPCLTFITAENQRQLVTDAAKAGLIFAPDSTADDKQRLITHVQALIGNSLLRESISRAAMRSVDGRGTARVRRALGVTAVSVREAHADDSRDVHEWRNHKTVRRASRNSTKIEWSAHSYWFDAGLANADRLLLIGEQAGIPVGVVRFDIAGDTAELSIFLAAGRTNRGLGAELLTAAENWLANARPEVQLLNAEVLADNRPSHNLFVGAGFRTDLTKYSKRMH